MPRKHDFEGRTAKACLCGKCGSPALAVRSRWVDSETDESHEAIWIHCVICDFDYPESEGCKYVD